MKDLIAQYPDSSLLRENLIQYYRDNDNYNQALSATQEAINNDTTNPRFRDIQATLYFENDDTIHAIQSLQKAIAIYPDPQYIMSLGSIYAQTKNPLALTMADLLIKDPKSQKESLFIKGLYYSSTGDNTKAIDYFNQALAVDYTFTFAYREKAICLYNMGKYKEAIDVLTKAVEVVNAYDEAYYWMGRCYEKLGDKDQAIKCYQLALKIDKDYTEAKDALTKLGVDE
ncbi:MAG: tetratricopeptide repeat protein [Ferruginibacter sp.]